MKLAKLVEGRTLGELKRLDPAAHAAAVTKLKKGIWPRTLCSATGTWSGWGMDNVLVDNRGQVWRIDNGGSLRYRAQGTKKASGQWGPSLAHPTGELFSLRDPKINASAAAVFGNLDNPALARQVAALAGKRAAC